MSIISNIIAESNFEIIRSKIAIILADELANQKALNIAAKANEEAKPEPDPLLIAFYQLNIDSIPGEVFEERFTRITKPEFPVLNVVFVASPLDALITNSSQVSVARYSIEAYASAGDSVDDPGDKLASIKLHRLLAISRSIIMNPNYIRLGFDTVPYIIGYRQCVNIIIGQPEEGADDVKHSIFGKFDVNVKCTEDVENLSGLPLEISNTVVKLFDTEKGFSWKYESN